MAPRRPFHSALSALALASALGLTACGGGAAADPSNSPAPTASETPDAAKPSPASSTAPARNIPVPEMPETAKANTKEGFEAFAKHYVDLLSFAYETNDTAPAKNLALSSCSTCNTTINSIDAAEKAGKWFVGGKVSTLDLATDFELSAAGNIQGGIVIRQEAFTVHRADGSPEPTVPAKETHPALVIIASYRNGAWAMVDLGKAKVH